MLLQTDNGKQAFWCYCKLGICKVVPDLHHFLEFLKVNFMKNSNLYKFELGQRVLMDSNEGWINTWLHVH